jgi:hypothetical protein
MQSPTRVHDGIAHAVLQEAYLVFHYTVAFHTANRVFDTEANRRDCTIGRFLRWGEFSPRGFFLGLDDRDPIARIALEAPILIETTAPWEGITCQIREAFIGRLPFIGRTQETHMTGLIDDEEVFARMALLLATVEFLLLLWISGAGERSFSTLMPKRGAQA